MTLKLFIVHSALKELTAGYLPIIDVSETLAFFFHFLIEFLSYYLYNKIMFTYQWWSYFTEFRNLLHFYSHWGPRPSTEVGPLEILIRTLIIRTWWPPAGPYPTAKLPFRLFEFVHSILISLFYLQKYIRLCNSLYKYLSIVLNIKYLHAIVFI